MSDTLLVNVLRALDVAVVERLSDSRFQMVGVSPEWLEAAFDTAPAGARHTLSGALPFLDHFLQQADAVWHERGAARADSGPFTAQVGSEEALLRATALTIDHRSLLVLERLTGDADTRPILQKAREQMLATEQLTRHAAAVHPPAAAIGRAADELAKADLPPDHRALVDALRAASAQLLTAVESLPKPPSKGRRFSSSGEPR